MKCTGREVQVGGEHPERGLAQRSLDFSSAAILRLKMERELLSY